jgi:N-acetylneuraminic acid mutarotase
MMNKYFRSGIACAMLGATLTYVPVALAWEPVGKMIQARTDLRTVRLSDGRVLAVCGRDGSGNSVVTAEAYDPTTGTWRHVASMAYAKERCTANLLHSGKVLVVGDNRAGSGASAETYDPVLDRWSVLSRPVLGRASRASVVTPNGKVVIVGGAATPQVEVFDPDAEVLRVAGNLLAGLDDANAVMLATGEVLVRGDAGGGRFATELFDPFSGQSRFVDEASAVGGASAKRYAGQLGVLMSGEAMVVGGYGQGDTSVTRVFDPGVGRWSYGPKMAVARANFSLTRLWDGRLLAIGGEGGASVPLTSVESLDAAAGAWTRYEGLRTARSGHSATRLNDGRVLVAGGNTVEGAENPVAEAEISARRALGVVAEPPPVFSRSGHTATLLATGELIVAGGTRGGVPTERVEIYDPVSKRWREVAKMNSARAGHTATLLGNGKLIVIGGYGAAGPLKTVELFDPSSGRWTVLPELSHARSGHTATLLHAGKLLVVGGYSALGGTLPAQIEMLDLELGRWSMPSSLPALSGRHGHTATILRNGNVLIAGGQGVNGSAMVESYMYVPGTNSWESAGPMLVPRAGHTASLLPSGRVLITSGLDTGKKPVAKAEVFDPTRKYWAERAWTSAGNMKNALPGAAAVVLLDGTVLVTGVGSAGASAEIYDPASLRWSNAFVPSVGRAGHTLSLLSSGDVLVVGGAPVGGDRVERVMDSAGGEGRPIITEVSDGMKLTSGSDLRIYGQGWETRNGKGELALPSVMLQRLNDGARYWVTPRKYFPGLNADYAGVLPDLPRGLYAMRVITESGYSEAKVVKVVK